MEASWSAEIVPGQASSKATHRNLVKIKRTKRASCVNAWETEDGLGQYIVHLHEDEKQICLWSLYLVEFKDELLVMTSC